MSYQPNPGHATACCGGDVHRLFPNYVIRMWMRDTQGGLAAALYGPCRVNTTAGKDHHPIEIVETTDYPFDEQIHFTLDMRKPVEFPLSLRIPGWCAQPSLLLNGQAQPLPAAKNRFVTLARKFHPGDTVTLVLPMSTAVSRWPDNGAGLERGPLVYSLPIKEQWTPVIEPRWSTADFPSWNAEPASVWNYGLAVDPAKLADEVRFERKAMTPDPWVDPPVSLIAPAQIIESWKLATVPAKPDAAADAPQQHLTPPLPSADARRAAGPEQQVTLVPYGSTHLRLTIFPRLGGGTAGYADATG
jgi:hypothetical protein